MNKTLPLVALKHCNEIKKIVYGYGNNFEVIEHADYVYLLKDRDPKSPFYFAIKQINNKQGKSLYILHYVPKSQENHGFYSVGVGSDKFMEYFNSWFDIMIQYYSIPPLKEDPIFESAFDYWKKEFKIVDEDANYAAFDFQQATMIEKYLTDVIRFIEEKKISDPENKQEYQEIIEDSISLKDELTSIPKQKVLHGLAKIWAKTQKIRLEYVKHIVFELSSEFAKIMMLGDGT